MGQDTRLDGKNVETRTTLTSASPYELSLWFVSESIDNGKIQLSEIELLYEDGSGSIFHVNEKIEKQFEKKTKDYMAFFSFQDIPVDHRNAILTIKYVLNRNNTSEELEAIIRFEKDYKDYRMIVSH